MNIEGGISLKLLGYRHVTVSEESEQMVDFFENKLGLANSWTETDKYSGGVFKSENSWLEFWGKSEDMPEMTMLQLIVDDADEFAACIKTSGVELNGPVEERGERIYSMTAPNRMPVTIQSSIK